MGTSKFIYVLFCVMLLFVAGCEKVDRIIKLPDIEPMTFEIPNQMKEFYEKLHKKGDAEYTYEEFFSENVRIPRPPFEMERRVDDKKKLVEIKTFQGKYDEADEILGGYLSQEERSVDALSFAGNYYLGRNRISDGLRFLVERAQKGNDPDYWTELIGIARGQHMTETKYEYLDQLIAAFPDSSGFYRMKIAELKEDKRTKELKTSLAEYYERFPDGKQYYLEEMWHLLSSFSQQEKAFALYEKELDPLNDTGATSDFFSFLSEARALRHYRKLWKKKTDKRSMLLSFLASLERGSWEEAEGAIERYVKKYPDDTYIIGRLYKRLGSPRNAYDYYLRTIAEQGESEKLLFEVFTLLTGSYTGSVCYNTKPSSDFIFSFDTDPGISGGLLSLYYNTLDYEKREDDLANVKGQLINVSFMFDLFSYITAQYPGTAHEDSLYMLMMRQLNTFSLYEHVVRLGGEYEKKPKKEAAVPVYEALAEAYFGLGDVAQGNRIYRELLGKLAKEERISEYHGVFERLISKLISQKNYEECTRLYWEEIKKHPEDRYLYERFLSLIYNYNLFDEELKVYRYAIQHFNEKTWYHKIARWYVRHRSEEAFRAQTKKIREIFDDKELEAYLREFVYFDSRKSFNDPGNRFYLAMYQYGMERFPDNPSFALGLIRFYRTSGATYERELVRLYKRYFFHDEEFRVQFLRYLAAKNMLKEYLQRAENNNGILYVLFRAEASRHLSMDEHSEKPLERLTVLYPDRLEFAERLANLYRSIDFSYYHEDRKLTEKGVGVFLREISLFPTVDTLYVQLGEMLVEANRYEKAKEEWLKRIDLYPGLEKSYLNVATILWDYYDFEDAAEIIKKGRAIFGSDTMLSREMAVIYEELKDYGNAIKEYINASLGGEYYYYEREEVIYRLQYLAKTYGLGKLIQKTFMEAIQANDEPDRIVSVYANYLERQGMYEEKLKMYAEALPFLRDPYRIREILNELEATDRSVLVVDYALRLVEITEEIDDYLLLASTYENQKNLSKSKSVYENMLKMFEGEDNEARRIMSNYSEFLWRNGEHARALDMLFRAQEISKGYTRESILSDLAYRALSVNDYKRAQRAFGLLLQEDPYNVNYFNLAGDMYQKLGDARELEKVYLEKIKVIEKSPLGYAIKRERTEALYLGLARRLKELKKKTRAQDYYIEAINRDPQNTSLLDEVYTFSKKENMVERLIQYYEMTAEKSFKDYRWQMVLVRFHMREGNLDNAIAQLGNAVTNQPQLAYLHEELADVLAVQGRYEEAIDAYEAAYVLTKGKSSITEKIALIYLRMGEKEKMFRKFDELIHSKPEGARKYFEVSAICLAYGLDEEAFQYAHRGRESLEAYPYKDYLSDDMLSTLSEAYLKRGRAEQLMRFLANQYKRYHSDTEKEESYARSEAYTRSSRIRYFISSTLGLIWNDFATDGDRQYLSEEFNGFSAFPYYSDIVRAYIQFAARAEVPGVTERVLLAQYEADKLKTSYPSLYEITNFYESRGAFEKLYRFLGRESRDHARIAMLARIVAPEEELAWLRKFYDESVQNYRRYGSTFYGYSPVIERYLDLLVSKGMDHELDGLLVSAASCNGQLLNYFFRRADGRRAFGIIDGGFPNKNGLWKKAKKAYVSFNLGYRKDEGVGYFKEILDIRPIGEKLERTPEEVLFGRDFYVNSFFFGEQDSSYLFAGIEAAPRSSGSFQHLGEYLAERERYGSAKDYLEKAMELSPTHEIYLSLAKTYLKLRDKNRALEVLKNMDGDDFYRKVQYINALMDVGFRKEAEEILAGYLRKHIDTMSYSDTRQGLALTKKVMHDREAFLKELAKLVVSNESFYSTVLAERKVDDIGFYIKRYMGLVEKGRARKDFYRRETFVERLFNEELYTEALELILVTEEGISEDSLPDWIIPRKAEIYIRMDRSGDGVKLLEGYIKRREYIPNSNEVLRVLDLAEGDGLELKRYVYEFLIGSGWSNMANYLGLAETYLEMERKEQAIETLNELAVRNEYGYRELFEIAKLLFAHRQFEQSAAFLEKAMMANPGLVEGRLLKAKLLIEQGSVQNGSELALEIISERNPQEVKGQAYLILERCGETALSLVERRILDGGSEALYIARARLLSSLNRKEEAISTLSDCLAEFPYASSAVHQQLAELLDDARSVEYLYRALYLRGDSQETILDLLLTLMELKRDDETAMLISRSDIDPSNYLGWYDRESAKDQYLSKVDYLISDTQEQLSPREREKMLLEVLSSTAAFYERREDYRAAEFIIESVFSLKKDDKLMKKVVELGMKAEEMEKESRFVIQEDIANGEPF